ncbi:MAG: permease, partial [Candidatus Eisenbacteria bacterium]|nr:permease [Candidatus Eisenbacteria bacterium]
MPRMLVPTIIMAVLAIGLLIVGVARGQNEHIAGLKVGMSMTIEVLPLILFAFILAGMIQVLIPSQTIGRWIGPESGTRGIFIGTLAGILTPGGPYVSFPIVAGLLRAGS